MACPDSCQAVSLRSRSGILRLRRSRPKQTLSRASSRSDWVAASLLCEDLPAAHDVRQVDDDLPVETAGTEQGGVEHVDAVGRGDHDHAFLRFEAVHFHEERVQRLFAFVMSAADAGETGTSHGVDLVDEDEAGGVLARLLEHVADAARADADEHLDEIGAADGEERHGGFAGNGFRHEGLAGARRAGEERSARDLAAEEFEFERVAEVFHDLLHLFLRLVAACHVVEFRVVVVGVDHAGAAFAELDRAGAGAMDLAREDEVEDEQDRNRDREVQEQGFPPHVAFQISGLHALFLQFGDNGVGGVDARIVFQLELRRGLLACVGG